MDYLTKANPLRNTAVLGIWMAPYAITALGMGR